MYHTGTEEVITEQYSGGDDHCCYHATKTTTTATKNKQTKNKTKQQKESCFETIFSTNVHRSACKIQLTTLGSLEYYSTWLSNILRHDLISDGNRTDLVFHSHGPTKRPFHIFQLANLASYLCAPIFLRFFL